MAGLRPAAAELLPGGLEMDVVLAPGAPYHVKVGVGQVKFMRFSCMGGPADVVISLSTYSERADPLLFLSLKPDEAPTFQSHHASSFGQWREDSSGDHYVIARAVSPRGGILGLVNMQHFADEVLDAVLSIRCTFIMAFDTLFWDHLRSSAVCPTGGVPSAIDVGSFTQEEGFCSGHGQCGKHGICECDGDHTGPACENPKSDIVVAAEGTYSFNVSIGRYQYFRVRVPPSFAGGYLEVKVWSEDPLVVLVRNGDLPTKSSYELSNFDDWINQRNTTDMKFEVAAADSLGSLAGPFAFLPSNSAPETGRRLAAKGPGRAFGGQVKSWGDLFRLGSWTGAAKFERSKKERRRLQDFSVSDATGAASAAGDSAGADAGTGQDGGNVVVKCPDIEPPADAPACKTTAFAECKSSCFRCVVCVKGGEEDRGCTAACNACISTGCTRTLAKCAGNQSCIGSAAQKCESGCSSCMACLDSNDRGCSGCGCCLGCLPLAAKCSVIQNPPVEYQRYVFVGIYNHRRYYNDRSVIRAFADISLTVDPDFQREELPSSWLAELYDPFHDVRSLELTQREVYPEGEQYIYDLEVRNLEAMHLEVRLYNDRLTLIHIKNEVQAERMVLDFTAGPNVTHILSSSKAAPKTFFDFQLVHRQVDGKIEITTNGEPAIWCAIFGRADGFVQIDAQTFGSPAAPVPIGFATVCVLGLLCGLLVLGVIYGGAQKLGDATVPLSERFVSLVRPQRNYESAASLTRAGSLQGYMGSDVIDRSVEDQYLHRGGIGDDGI